MAERKRLAAFRLSRSRISQVFAEQSEVVEWDSSTNEMNWGGWELIIRRG